MKNIIIYIVIAGYCKLNSFGSNHQNEGIYISYVDFKIWQKVKLEGLPNHLVQAADLIKGLFIIRSMILILKNINT